MEQMKAEIIKLAGPPVEVTGDILDSCRSNNEFGHLFFELYKEATSLIRISTGVRIQYSNTRVAFNLDQAICVGLMVRIYKFMTSVIKLSSGIEHADVIQALNRCIIESAVNLQYLLVKHDDTDIFGRFVTTSLTGERVLYDIINENIKSRGGKQLKIEQGMLISISETCNLSGVSIEDIDFKSRNWDGNFRDKLKTLNLEDAYVSFQMMPSHAVHGDWVDLIKHHLLPSGGGFEPNYNWNHTDGVLLGPVALFVIDAAREYLTTYFNDLDTGPVHERLDSLQERLLRVEFSLQEWQLVN